MRSRDLETNYRRIIDWITDGRLKVEPLLTRIARPEECQEAYTLLVDHKDQELGIVFDWTGT